MKFIFIRAADVCFLSELAISLLHLGRSNSIMSERTNIRQKAQNCQG